MPSAKDGEMPAAVLPDATKIEVCPGEWKPCCYADNVSMPACKQRLSHVVWMCKKRATPNKLACCTVCCAWLIGSRAQWPDPDVLEKQTLGNKFFLACESCVRAVALEQNSVRRSRGNLNIDDAVWQDGDVALSTPIPPKSNDSAITL